MCIARARRYRIYRAIIYHFIITNWFYEAEYTEATWKLVCFLHYSVVHVHESRYTDKKERMKRGVWHTGRRVWSGSLGVPSLFIEFEISVVRSVQSGRYVTRSSSAHAARRHLLGAGPRSACSEEAQLSQVN